MTDTRRIIVSGMGAVSAAGIGAPALWQAARDGRSCVAEVRFQRPYRGRIKLAAQVQDFNPSAHITEAELPFCDPVTQYVLTAASEALVQAGLAKPLGPRTAIIIGTGAGGMSSFENGLYRELVEHLRPDPLIIPRWIPSACPSQLSIRYGATGPCFAVASACSSATQAIGLGMQLIRSGAVDRAIVGGTEDCITNSGILAWEVLRVLTPDFCRPFSRGRNGMVLGAGAAVFVLEEAEIARARGAAVIAELAGYGTSTDAKDPVRPDAQGAAACMRNALADAAVEAGEIDYVNAHGTGTIVNDATESEALGIVFGNKLSRLPVSSTKPIHGHGLGASGALELVVTIGAVRENIAPPTINWREADVKCPIDPVPNEARPLPIKTALTNSFAFGGIKRKSRRAPRRGGMSPARAQAQPPAGAPAPEQSEDTPVRLPPLPVRTEPGEIAGFLRETASREAGDFVPLTFPFRWMALPDVRGLIFQGIGGGDFLPVHEAQSFVYDQELRIEHDYVLDVEARRSASPPRLTVQMSVSTPQGKRCAHLETVLRIVPARAGGAP